MFGLLIGQSKIQVLTVIQQVRAVIYLLGSSTVHAKGRIPKKVLLLAWLCFAFLISACYDCNLRAYLLVREYERPVDSAKDILELGRRLYLARGAGLINDMELSTKEVYKQLLTRVEKQQYILRSGSRVVQAKLRRGLSYQNGQSKTSLEGLILLFTRRYCLICQTSLASLNSLWSSGLLFEQLTAK